MSHFPRSSSALCQDCDQIGDNLKACACCGSQSIIALANCAIAPTVNNSDTPSEYAIERALLRIEQEANYGNQR